MEIKKVLSESILDKTSFTSFWILHWSMLHEFLKLSLSFVLVAKIVFIDLKRQFLHLQHSFFASTEPEVEV